jgi:hypothetical protein
VAAELTWTFDQTHHAGVMRLPDGRLTLGSLEDELADTPPLQLGDVGVPDELDAYVCTATAEPRWRACAALELRALTNRPVASWKSIPGPKYYEEGPLIGLGAGFLGSLGALEAGPILESDVPLVGDHDTWSLLVREPHGSCLVFAVFGQHPVARTWLGTDTNDHFCRLVVDLDVLYLDPSRSADLPWDPH